jgi:hypothetical protein
MTGSETYPPNIMQRSGEVSFRKLRAWRKLAIISPHRATLLAKGAPAGDPDALIANGFMPDDA